MNTNADAIYHDGTYLENNPGWHEQDSPWKARNIASLLAANRIRPATVCEIGCGAGEVLRCLADDFGEGVDFTGYDISPQALALCRAKQRGNLRFHQKDLLQERGPVYDVAMAIDVFEHVEDYFGFLRRLRHTARYKVFHIPLDLSVQTVLRGTPLLKQRADVGHIHYFTRDTALAALRDTGYEVLDHAYTSGYLALANRGFKAGLLKLPRRLLYALNQDLAVRLLGGFSLMVLAR